MLYTPRFLAITVINFLSACNMGAFYLFPLFIYDQGGTAGDVGYIMGAFPLAAVLSRPLISKGINRFGRKGAYSYANLLMVFMTIAYLTFSGGLCNFYVPLLIVRAIHGVSGGAVFSAGFTYAVDIIPETRMNEGVGIYGSSGLLGFALGPVIAELIIHKFSFSAYFVGAAVPPAIGVLILFFLPETYRHRHNQSGEGFLTVLRRPKVVIMGILILILGVGMASTSGFISIFAHSRGIAFVSAYFLAYSGSAVAMRLMGGRLADRFGERKIVPYAMILCGGGLLILIIVNNIAFLIFAGLLSGSAHGMLYPCLITIAVRNETSALRGKILAIVTGSIDTGLFGGSIILGQVGKYFGLPAIFLVAGLSFFVGLVIFLARPVRSGDRIRNNRVEIV